MSEEERTPIPWPGGGVMIDSWEAYGLPNGHQVVGQFRTFANDVDAARTTAQVFFRWMLTNLDIDWRSGAAPPGPEV